MSSIMQCLAHTTLGPVVGRAVETPDGQATAYLGIPFGDVVHRFQRASQPADWSQPRECLDFGPGAPQDPDRADTFSIDERGCLTANVWAPAAESESKRPVVVWVHGGGHLYGSNTHPLCDGARLAAFGDLVVVAGNYRLGAFGYLTLAPFLGEEFADSGNVALLDLVDLLRWVRDNAEAFGGDPENVTIMGQSAGAVMTATLMAMPVASGLFRRVIVESGSAERTQSVESGASLTVELLDELSLTFHDAEHLLSVPWVSLVAAQERLIASRSKGRPNLDLAFRPTVDGRTLSRPPIDAVRAGASNHVDMIVGTNVNEASGFVDLRADDGAVQDMFESQASILLPRSVRPGADYLAALNADTRRSNSLAEALEACMADVVYRQPTQRLLDARAGADGSTRAYLFAWARPESPRPRRAGHSLELPFVFRHIDDSVAAFDEIGRGAPAALRDRMSSGWSEFVRDGEPRDWPIYSDSRVTSVLDAPSRLVNDPRSALRRLVASAGA